MFEALPNPTFTEEVLNLCDFDALLDLLKKQKICGIFMETSGQDRMDLKLERINFALPGGQVFVISISNGNCNEIISRLVDLLACPDVQKVMHNAKRDFLFLRNLQKHKLVVPNIFDLLLASQLEWAGYYYLSLSGSPKNPWKKSLPDHSMAAMAERHLGIRIENFTKESKNTSEDNSVKNTKEEKTEDSSITDRSHLSERATGAPIATTSLHERECGHKQAGTDGSGYG